MTTKNYIYLKFNFVKSHKYFYISFRVINYHLFPQQHLLHGGEGCSNNLRWGKQVFKRYLPNFRSIIMETELRILKFSSRAPAKRNPIIISLFHIKITGYVTKSSQQDPGPSYLHLPIFCLYIHSPLLKKKKFVVIAVFLSKLGHRPLFNGIYYETIPV